MDEQTPSLNEIRADYIRDHTRNFDTYLMGRSLTSEQEFYGAQFDAALAAHDAQVLRDAAEKIKREAVADELALNDMTCEGELPKLSRVMLAGVSRARARLIAEADRIEEGTSA